MVSLPSATNRRHCGRYTSLKSLGRPTKTALATPKCAASPAESAAKGLAPPMRHSLRIRPCIARSAAKVAGWAGSGGPRGMMRSPSSTRGARLLAHELAADHALAERLLMVGVEGLRQAGDTIPGQLARLRIGMQLVDEDIAPSHGHARHPLCGINCCADS